MPDHCGVYAGSDLSVLAIDPAARIMRYLTVNWIRGEQIYSVYNSKGALALYTRDWSLALRISEGFRQLPTATEVVVSEARPNQPKRR